MGLAKIVLPVLIVSGFQFNFITSADDLLENVKIRCYTNGGLDTRYNEYDVEKASELNLDASKSTVVYVHGWNENVNNSETLPKIVNSFLQRNEHNVCVLDFKDLAESYYKIMVDNVPQLSTRMAFVLKNWIENGLNPNLIHLIGYSIGAHVCGLIGRLLLNVGYVIGRITGLDPANLLYCTSGDTPHRNALKKGDAKFVDVIHTDGGWAGCMFPLGDADFYPNKGTRNQPMCENSSVKGLVDDILDACSHHAAVVYFADSVLADPLMYLSTNRQNEELTAPMGYHCPASAMGSYDLVTD